jgi:ABC transporter substrate binding protein (PQQ-dependent alcohol dehydrogenase system)
MTDLPHRGPPTPPDAPGRRHASPAWPRPRRLAALLALLLLPPAQALTIGVLQRADDARLDPRRTALAYLGQPLGTPAAGLRVAFDESKFPLDAAGLAPRIEVAEVAGPEQAREAAERLARQGAVALVADLPAAWLLAAATARVTVFNTGEAADALREQDCRANLLHTLPSERMRSDALAQWLVARRWSQVLLLRGPLPEDAARAASVKAALARYRLQLVAERPFKASADPRERQLANPLLLTGSAEYDAVWVVDSDGEFARGLPYRTALPRPVVGDGGLAALAWAPNFERFGAPQLARRFQRAQGRPMTAHDWAAWAAGKAIVQAALAAGAKPDTAGVAAALTAPRLRVDGFKGTVLSFRPWDRQLRQPLLLTDGLGVVAMAPVDGVLHPSDTLDTLGADAAEKRCPSR